MITQLSDECKTRLFRLTLRAPVEGIAFVMADSREAAWRIGRTVISVLQSVAIYEVELADVRSFAELVQLGVSDDADVRIFEMKHDDNKVTNGRARLIS